ncbi:hypothetical protein [Vibrio sp. WXL210]|uniref:hypothetical protein n=1 Tax=Vibrio sp. WXL210 TaxID=3450709 RepID=UPI003EC4FD40
MFAFVQKWLNRSAKNNMDKKGSQSPKFEDGLTLEYYQAQASSIIKADSAQRLDNGNNCADNPNTLQDTTQCLQSSVDKLHAFTDSFTDKISSLATAKGNDLSDTRLQEEVKVAKAAIDESYEAIYKKTQTELWDLFTTAKSNLCYLKQFRERYGLNNFAVNPDKSMISVWALLAILWILESLANAYFFSGLQDLGLAGGFVISAALSASNIVLGYSFGCFSRDLRKKVNKHRNISYAFLFTFAVLAISLNMTAAMIRLAKGDISVDELLFIISNWEQISVKDVMNSLLLFIIGMSICCWSFAKSYALYKVRLSEFTKKNQQAVESRRDFMSKIDDLELELKKSADQLLCHVNASVLKARESFNIIEALLKNHEKICFEEFKMTQNLIATYQSRAMPNGQDSMNETGADASEVLSAGELELLKVMAREVDKAFYEQVQSYHLMMTNIDDLYLQAHNNAKQQQVTLLGVWTQRYHDLDPERKLTLDLIHDDDHVGYDAQQAIDMVDRELKG